MVKKSKISNPTKERYEENRIRKRSEIIEAYNRLQRRRPDSPVTVNEFTEAGYNKSAVETYFGSLEKLRKIVKERYPTSINYPIKNATRVTDTRIRLIRWYAEIYNKLGTTPSRDDIRKDGRFTIHMINNHFGSITNLEEISRKELPNQFKDVSLDSIKTISRITKLRNTVENHSRFVITTAVAGCAPHEPFLASLKRFCRANKAKLLVLVCEDPAKPKDPKTGRHRIHKRFLEETIIVEDTRLNSNLFISTVKLSAKAIKPTTGLNRIGKTQGSYIYASPKIFLEYTSVRNNKYKLPHFIATTGAATVPNYTTEMYMSLRTAYIAENDHKLGATYVELVDDSKFHFTQIECKSNNGEIFFRDMAYRGDNDPRKIRAEALIMGDLHAGATDPSVVKCWDEVIEATRPKCIAIHDGFNGISVNGHIENDIVEKTLRALEGKDDVKAEILIFANSLKHWASKTDKLYVVPSNHNDWVERWVRANKVFKGENLANLPLALELLQGMLKRKNPLQYAIEEILNIKIPNVVWLGRNEDVIIEGIQVNCHGDRGVKNSKGSLMGMVNAYAASFSGHSHTAGILFDAWAVGTSGPLQEDYNNGPGTWTNTSGLIYKYGCRALINVIDGEWRKP